MLPEGYEKAEQVSIQSFVKVKHRPTPLTQQPYAWGTLAPSLSSWMRTRHGKEETIKCFNNVNRGKFAGSVKTKIQWMKQVGIKRRITGYVTYKVELDMRDVELILPACPPRL